MSENPLKTPGVYIEEVSTPPTAVATVSTGVPVFIGYTQKADDEGRSLAGQPVRISSLAEFERLFGTSAEPQLSLEPIVAGGLTEVAIRGDVASYGIRRASPAFYLHPSLVLFFLNGGGPCYIISAGGYDELIDSAALIDALNALKDETEPSLVVIPDALSLDTLADCVTVQQVLLAHCAQSGNRFAILDVYEGYRSRDVGTDCIARFRGALGINHLSHGAAYYPWLHANLPGSSEVTHRHFDARSRQLLRSILSWELGIADAGPEHAEPSQAASQTLMLRQLAGEEATDESPMDRVFVAEDIDRYLSKLSDAYKRLLSLSRDFLSLVPAGGAIAGIYASVDRQRGVWKAPANVSLNGVKRLSVLIGNEEQEDLNVTPHGKSVNAIRAFAGRGILVWGARTLDGNNEQWRYISVRRTAIMIEQSIRRALKGHVFEPNEPRTWSMLKKLLENFLVEIWRHGGLSGSRAEEAFAVRLGLGETMNEQDILQGLLRITVMVAPLRPAEFIVIEISQQMMER